MIKEFFGILLAISFSMAYIPQIIKTLKSKKSKDISIFMLIINAVGYSSGIIYILLCESSAFWLWVNYSLGLLMTITCIVVCYILR